VLRIGDGAIDVLLRRGLPFVRGCGTVDPTMTATFVGGSMLARWVMMLYMKCTSLLSMDRRRGCRRTALLLFACRDVGSLAAVEEVDE